MRVLPRYFLMSRRGACTLGSVSTLQKVPETRGYFWLQHVVLAKKALQKLWGGVADLHGDRLLLPDEPCLEDGQGLGNGSGLGKYLELEGLEEEGMCLLCGL